MNVRLIDSREDKLVILEYKGFKSTRVVIMAIIWFTADIMLFNKALTGAEWVELTKWLFLAYGGSEVGAKVATAIKK